MFETLLPNLPHKSGDRRVWGELAGAAPAFLAAQIAVQHQGVLVIITGDTQTATQLDYELRFFLSDDLPILHFNDWETLPYDQFSPHQDIISERIKTLAQLPQLDQGILIVPMTTLAHKIAPKGYLGARSFSLKLQQKIDSQEFRRQLESAGYTAVETVFEHGEFAVRGSLIDLFPMGSELPLRIELFDDEIDTLRYFNQETQRSTESI